MKRILMLATMTAALFLSPNISWAQNGYDLYQKALVKERAVGNIEEAIRLYQRVVKEFSQDHALAAKAQLRLGLLYERLGRKAEAHRALQVVLSQYSDQVDVVRQARAGLARTSVAANAKAKPAPLTVRQLWAGSGVDPLGKPLPDGKTFVFTDWETGDIVLRELAGGKTRRLTNKGSWLQSSEFGITPVASPDGKQVAYYWSDKNQQGELRVVGIDGAAPRVLYRSEAVASPIPVQWSPDGKQVLTILMGTDKTNQLAFVSLASGTVRSLKSLGLYYPLSVSISPDGRYIAYDLLPDEEAVATDIYLWSVEEERETLLVKHRANDIPLGWTPDGKRLLFASDRMGSMGAWLLQVISGKAQGAPELARPEMGLIFPMAFAKDGSYFFGLPTGLQDVYAVTMDWTTEKPLEAPAPVSQKYTGANSSADWSQDGKLLAWVTRRGLPMGEMGWQTLSIHSFETGMARELKLKLNSFDRPRWSPDGRFVLLYGAHRKGEKGIYRVDVNTGELMALALDEANTTNRQATWTVDGKAVLLERNNYTSKSCSFVAKEIATGQEREIYRVNQTLGGSHLAPSPDGQHIAIVVFDQAAKTSTIKLVPFGGGEARDLFVQPQDAKASFFFSGLAWMPDGRELIVVKGNAKNEEPNSELWRLPIAGGEIRKFTLSRERVRDLRIHPDGKRLAFTSGNQKVEVWVMENLPPSPPPKRTSVSRR